MDPSIPILLVQHLLYVSDVSNTTHLQEIMTATVVVPAQQFVAHISPHDFCSHLVLVLTCMSHVAMAYMACHVFVPLFLRAT